jgi:hypothetical protein
MKKLIYCSFVLCVLAACKKESAINNGGSGSIILKESPTANSGATFIVPPFTSQDSTMVYQLMQGSNLSTNGFAFYFYESYNALDQNNQMGFYQIAEARQVRNGLPVFFEDLTFGFENGKLNGPPPASQFIVGNITLDNKPNLSLQTLRTEFIKLDNAQEAHSLSIQDSTLVAQLGYYNLNINQMPSGGTPSYIKAWYVHPAHSPWPQGYFRDDTGATLFFTPFTHSGPQAP